MSNFRITKFKSRNSSVVYVKDAAIHDLFRNSANSTDTKKIMDFMCSPTYEILEVQRLTDNQLFTRSNYPNSGTRMQHGSMFITIISINIQNGEVVFNRGGCAEKTLTNAVIWTPPTTPTIPTVTGDTIVNANNSANSAQQVTTSASNLTPAQKDAFFANIQNQILAANPRALRLPDLMKKRTETLAQFLVKFFTKWNNIDQNEVTHRDTLYADDMSVQTKAGKRRSFGDLFMICRYYYPSLTAKQLYKALLVDVTPLITEGGFRTSKCSQINKRVWYYDQNNEHGTFDMNVTDEYGNKIETLKLNLQ